MNKTEEDRPLTFVLVLISVALYALRMQATKTVGFGDSEALYACYAFHPAAAYLDHPGLIGMIARAIGGGTAPTPEAAHTVTSLLVTVFPWLGLWTARALGADRRGALLAAIALAVTPEIAIGLFALTPDLPLALGWLATFACVGVALRSDEDSLGATAAFVGAGLFAGIASTAKVSGLLLLAALAWTYAANPKTRRSPWAWAGIALGLVAFAPVVLFEARNGFPMLQHRLVDTQGGAGVSLRNVGALVGGQLAYVSPLYLLALIWLFLDLRKNRARDPVDAFLWRVTVLPLAALTLLTVVSRVAEPHWVAPAFLALPMYFARNYGGFTRISPRFRRVATGIAFAMVVFVHAWVLSPSLVKYAPKSLDPKYDLANELFGWPDVAVSAKEMLGDPNDLQQLLNPIPVVGPYWTVCAQLHAQLGPHVPVGCMTPIRDDFDDWQPRPTWQNADMILFITDNRFPVDLEKAFPDRVVVRRAHTTVFRGGRIARTFSLVLLQQRAGT